MSSQDVPAWVSQRILAFFNQAQNVDDILNGSIQDDPSDGPGRTIGPKLAARILRTRNQLPARRFREFRELDDIPGVGAGTIKDLVYSFGAGAAEAFQSAMYDNGLIYRENWTLEYSRTMFDKDRFEELAFDEAKFRAFVVEKVDELSRAAGDSEEMRQRMLDNLSSTYIDVYNNGIPAAGYALALWFYEHDADNWFSWERIQEQTGPYFEHHIESREGEMELRFFKGFELVGLIRPGITPEDLPVVLNWAEQSITLWFSALYD